MESKKGVLKIWTKLKYEENNQSNEWFGIEWNKRRDPENEELVNSTAHEENFN